MMNPVGTSSIVFVTLSGLFWGGWVVGSQTPEGQEALARAYAAYAEQQAAANESLFDTTALRAVVCGADQIGPDGRQPRPCLAVSAAGRMFVVDAGSGAADALRNRSIPMDRLEAVLLTSVGATQTADLNELFTAAAGARGDVLLPVYGPADTQRMVDGLNAAGGFDGMSHGLQAWAPAPEPERSVIVFEGDGLTISAFTTAEDAYEGRVGYRFDYRGRSIVIAGDGRVESAQAAYNADVLLHSAQSVALAQLHEPAGPLQTIADVAQEARLANAGRVVFTGAGTDVAASLQIQEARAAGLSDAVAGRVGMVVELPLTNRAVNVRTL
jgi:ribonuclease BN (tRNA processing enzyme)